MKRPKRALEVFSLSALDLFASAMGAFMIITLIIFPYYGKTGPAAEKAAAAQKKLAAIKASADAVQEKADAAKSAADAAGAKAPTKKELAQLEHKVAKLRASTRAIKAKLDALGEQYERGMPFSILGIETQATSMVILIDMSGSMQSSIPYIKETVKRILTPLDKKTKLEIIGFQGESPANLWRWPSFGGMRPLDVVAKDNAEAYVRKLMQNVDGGTPTFDALKAAISAHPDSIFLLSDGAPSGMDWHEIIRRVEMLNNGRSKINSVAIGDYTSSPDLIAFLRDLASQNGGAFVGVNH